MISLAQSARAEPASIVQDATAPAAVPVTCAVMLALVAPFEVPVLAIGGFTVTSVEVAVTLAVITAAAAILYAGRPIVWRTPVSAPVAACLAVATLAALASDVDRGNALRFAGRMTAAGVVFLLTVNAISTWAQARRVVRAFVAVGAILSVVAVLEAAQVPAVLDALTVFRPGFHVVGGQLRATSTFAYPTIASMYLEVVFCLGLWLVIDTSRPSRRLESVLVVCALATISAGIVATFTRAGLIAVAVALALAFAAHRAKAGRFDAGHVRLLALGVTVVMLILATRSADVLLARLRTEGTRGWYGATYHVPATLALVTGAEYHVPVSLENTGRVVWDSSSAPMFAVSYHWVRPDTGAVVQFNGWRTRFPAPVAPGETVTVAANIKAPDTPGNYVLVWDIVHENRAWLSTEGIAPGRSAVTVRGARMGRAGGVDETPLPELPSSKVRPGRLRLWEAALRISAASPLLGVGPDNFRKTYGAYVADGEWDTRVHANNMYLEALAGAGMAGFAALLWLVLASGRALWHRWRVSPPRHAAAAASLGATWVAIAGHGLVDSFLSFTPTYVTFALAAGLAFSPGLRDADRV